jgi:predicted amidohydrolase
MNFSVLQTKTSLEFKDNLKNLVQSIQDVPKNSLILAPELCLTGYAYDNIKQAAVFGELAVETLKKQSANQTIGITISTEENNLIYNRFYLFCKQQIIHTQNKVKLFTLNNEEKFFKAGEEKQIQLFEANDLKIGVLICFELRFIHLWEKLKGADIILVPAMWGEARKAHYELLCQALAVANQCFVLASDSANEECAKGSAIISPFGEVLKDDSQTILSQSVDLNEIKRMRTYLPVGIKP